MRDDEMGSHLRRQMAERNKINYVPLDAKGSFPAGDSDGTYPSEMSPCACSNRLVAHPTKKDTLQCTGCGNEVNIASLEDDSKLKGKHGKQGKKLFAISQQPNKRERDYDLPEDATLTDSAEWIPDNRDH